MKKRTKIVCTIGPASNTEPMLRAMVGAGMNVARLNFSHGTHEEHGSLIARIRDVEKKTGEPIAILQDLQGPKIRIGRLPQNGMVLLPGEQVVFDTDPAAEGTAVIPVDYAELHHYVRAGHRLLIADGKIETRITSVSGTRMTAEVVVGGTIVSHKGINVPDTPLTVRAMTEKDKEDARFGVEHDVDLIALSFVRSADDIRDAREWIQACQKMHAPNVERPIAIIAKIERREAVTTVAEILDAADGIMVARGDLGVEVPAEEVPLIQKKLIDAARARAKPVIVATQMLDSMQENPRATRAEVSDVANAVIDHADAVMLSNETATGKYPLEAVQTMALIISETETSAYDDVPLSVVHGESTRINDVVSALSRLLAERIDAVAILAVSLSGETGRLISRVRPELPIFVGTLSSRTQRQLNLSWGVRPFVLLPCDSIEAVVQAGFAYLKNSKHAAPGDRVVIVAGEPVGIAGHVNVLEVREVI